MAAGWSVQETSVLVSIWREADVQSQLDGVSGSRYLGSLELIYLAIASYSEC